MSRRQRDCATVYAKWAEVKRVEKGNPKQMLHRILREREKKRGNEVAWIFRDLDELITSLGSFQFPLRYQNTS